jgi:dTDP-glucose 4,6-dehydratase
VKTILVTGGAGFLGSWFVRHLLSTGWLGSTDSEPPVRGLARVVVLDKLTYAGSRASLAEFAGDPQLVFRQGDIADSSLLAPLLEEFRPQAVINYAAETHVDRSIDAPSPFVSTNVAGTWQLLEQVLRHWRSLSPADQAAFRFLHISTDEVFGPIDPPHRASESSPYHPSSPYAASKAAADHFVRAYHRTYGLPVLVVHPSNSYGPFQFPEKLIPLMILNAFEGRPLPIYGDGRQSRDWLFGEDLCRAVVEVLKQGRAGESYNVATGNEIANEALVRRICAIIDPNSARLITHVADRPGHDTRYALDTAKIRALGWSPQVELADGLERTIKWYVENRAWTAEVTKEFDRTRRPGTGAL